jgi:flavodoxin
MTRALVVYESVFGDVATIARAIAEGLSARLPADAVPVAAAPQAVDSDVRLLVVGGPTHAFGMPRPATREEAIEEHGAEIPDTSVGLHEWLDAVRLAPKTNAAAFDTRMTHPKLITKLDHAAKTEEKLLRGLGATLVTPAEHFVVTDTTGPLADGEEERARGWGRALGEIVAARPANSSD